MSALDYGKWDKMKDSDDEAEEQRQRLIPQFDNDDVDVRRELQEDISQWLRKQIGKLKKHATEPGSRRPPELKEQIPYRNVTKEEREVLAMLMAVSHFEEGETNLTRHPEMLELVRHHRWMEEDPGTLELLCRIHNNVMQKSGQNGHHETASDTRMRFMLLSGINTLAAPTRAKCPGGLLEMITQICTPENENSRDMRKKWQKKEFAKDALFDSLFPDLRQYNEENSANESMLEIWVFVIVILLLVIGIVVWMMYGHSILAPGAANAAKFNISKLATTTTTTTLTTTLAPEGPTPDPRGTEL